MTSSPLRLEHYFYPRVEVRANPEYSKLVKEGLKNSPESGIETKVSTLKAEEDPNFYQVQLTIRSSLKANSELPYKILLHAIGFFHVDQNFENKNIDHLVEINGASVLYSAAREYLMMVTSRGAWESFKLPTVNFRLRQSRDGNASKET